MTKRSLHSICRWTFHSGKGGFVPGNIRPEWNSSTFGTAEFIHLVHERIGPSLPTHIKLGVELHFDHEVSEENADEIARALVDTGLSLAMISPGVHYHFGYGGIASLDPKERKQAEEFGERTVDLAYGPLRKAWHSDTSKAPTLVIWNGSFGYDLATPAVGQMYRNLKESLAALCEREKAAGGGMFIALEPKPNEGHPAMLLPTVASAVVMWRKLEEEFGISRLRKGVNKEFGHSEMIGLDHVYDTVEELDHDMMVHVHLNSQGYNDGIVLGGPGKYDIDHGVRLNGMNVAIARLMLQAGYGRWKGHDMQVRPYDDTRQAIDRVIRSILTWEACEQAAQNLDVKELNRFLRNRETAKAEDCMRHAVGEAQRAFDSLYERTGLAGGKGKRRGGG